MKILSISLIFIVAYSNFIGNGASQGDMQRLRSTSSINDTLYWSFRKLSWKDFRAEPPKETIHGAESFVSISMTFLDSEDFYIPKVRSFFLRDMSWASEQEIIYSDSAALAHEQGHFDIEEVYARKLRRVLKLSGYNAILKEQFTENTNSNINKYYLQIIKEAELAQKKYDIETNHSLNEILQVWWNKAIADSLVTYEKW